VIKTFADRLTAAVFVGLQPYRFSAALSRAAHKKLKMIDRAGHVDDLRIPPGNRLEKLTGDRAGQWSIRINDQWRVCFVFKGADAYAVEIADCH
jgi:proteic killer suppression protein